MFLDDQLLKICKEADLTQTENIKDLYINVMFTCDSYIKERVNEKSTEKELKTIIDKAFNLFDSFSKSLAKSNDSIFIILSTTLFKEGTFKAVYLENEQIKRIYYSL